ncbi:MULTISPECIES: phosphomannomutase/phosphoglucomutase [unclassified Helicobacter]|uniref:phosphomannomutase/phosphoglucomutase n=1 Tax=unclassified Helicobacter TaxID=2593540 RepID=UPI000CF0998A|nr:MULTISPECIES: phosphomannomutase/phosphoglucomutase [unclassified Helicobacter]
MSIYREYDIRGIFEQDLTQDIVFKIGFFLGQVIKEKDQNQVIIGYDARVHSEVLLKWLSDGLRHSEVEVFCIGMVPTPVAYFSTFHTIESIECKNSIMITGSHNPPQYNGFKITIDQKPFYGDAIQKLKKKIEQKDLNYQAYDQKLKQLNALNIYIDFLTKHFKALENFSYPVALDYGNGVGALAMQKILKNLNINFIDLFATPDGTFPNHHPDPSEEKNLNDLKKIMSEKDIPIGLAFDGDADRIALLNKNYPLKGDELAILFAKQIASNGESPLVIGEVKCSQIMYDTINQFGSSIMYKTGHSNLKVKLKELNAHLAVEMSGHMFFNDRYYGYDDAIYAGLRALELFLNDTPEGIYNSLQKLPKLFSTPEEKIPTTEEQKFTIIEKLKEKLKNPPKDFLEILEIIEIDGVRVIFKDGWGLIRASNTTPVLVTRFEALNEEKAMLYKKALLSLLSL